jgi:hypothetical protein
LTQAISAACADGCTGPSRIDRGAQRLKHHLIVDANGIRLPPHSPMRLARVNAQGIESAAPRALLNQWKSTVDEVPVWSLGNERALAPTTARTTFALRPGCLAESPVSKLEPAERPRWARSTSTQSC